MAVNLDGGGSSAFVGREGTVLNGISAERTMPTAVICAEKKVILILNYAINL